jgi:DNA-binding SARP family transcriptional activator
MGLNQGPVLLDSRWRTPGSGRECSPLSGWGGIWRRWWTTAVIVGLAAVPLAVGPVPAVASSAPARPGEHRISPAAAAAKRRAEALAAARAAAAIAVARADAIAVARADVIAHERPAGVPQPFSDTPVAPASARAAVPRLPARTQRAAAGPTSPAVQVVIGLVLVVMGALAGAGSVELLRRRRQRSPRGSAPPAAATSEWLTAPVPAAAPDPPCLLAAAPSSSLFIGVLGTFTINGAPAALKPAQGQLLLSLALKGDEGMSSARMCDLLGPDPDHPKPGDSLRQLITRTRRQLGRPSDGREWIEHRGGGWYALHPDARFDWADFEELSERGIRESDRALLSGGLALVRGEPFRDCYWWWLDQAFLRAVGTQIAQTALTLAELELAAGDGPASAHAARVGLGIDPADERLWRALMRAEHEAGRPAGVQDAWNACLAVVADIALDGQPHRDTAALYRELTACPSGDGVRRYQEPSLT